MTGVGPWGRAPPLFADRQRNRCGSIIIAAFWTGRPTPCLTEIKFRWFDCAAADRAVIDAANGLDIAPTPVGPQISLHPMIAPHTMQLSLAGNEHGDSHHTEP